MPSLPGQPVTLKTQPHYLVPITASSDHPSLFLAGVVLCARSSCLLHHVPRYWLLEEFLCLQVSSVLLSLSGFLTLGMLVQIVLHRRGTVLCIVGYLAEPWPLPGR